MGTVTKEQAPLALMEGRRVPPKFRLVKLEVSLWFADTPAGQALLSKTGRIYGIFLYDEQTVTHLCSFAGSYWLLYIGVTTEHALDEDTQEALAESVSGTEDNYYDVGEIDAIADTPEYKQDADACTPFPEDTYDEFVETLREFYTGNPPW